MKYAKFAAVVFVLYFLGYVLGPTIAPMLVKDRKDTNDLVQTVEYKGAQYKINLAEIRDDALPKTVEITKATKIPTISGEGEVALKEGDVVILLNRKGGGLIVEKGNSNGKGTIKATDTDIYAQLVKQVYEREAGTGGGALSKVTPPDTLVTPNPGPAPMVPIAKVDPVLAPTPIPSPVVKPITPEPTPTPDPAPAGGGKLTDEQIIELMKKSIAGGAVKEFTSDQVKGWKINGDETIDGTEYQTGLAAYEAATIFGVRPVQAKALIKGGNIERWVYAKSGMEIQ